MTVSTKLEKKLLKNSPSRFSVLTAVVLGKKELPIKKFTSPSNQITLNTSPLSYFMAKLFRRISNLNPGVWGKIFTD